LDQRPGQADESTIKDGTVKRYFYETHDQVRTHLRDFVDAYTFGRRLKTFRGPHPIRIRLQRLDVRDSISIRSSKRQD
jgi:hypothetical protein